MINFYRCNHCGNIVAFLHASGVTPDCCGEEMMLLRPGVTDGATEKHVPVIVVNGDRVMVSVGAAEHPMTDGHHIDWIVLETNRGMHVTNLKVADGKAEAGFTLQKGELAIAAYEYCNLHGLWMATV